MLRPVVEIDQVIQNYSQIRAAYQARSEGVATPTTVLSDPHGFFLSQPGNYLTERFASLDKLFYTLVQGVVEDPDFAVRKDSKIYEKMLRDPQIFYCLFVRKAAINGLPWNLKPAPGKEQDPMATEIARAAENRLRQIPRFSELLDNMQDALLPGLSVNELVWKLTDQKSYVVADHYPVNKDRIKFDKQGRLYLLSPAAPTTGQLCPPYKFITHIFNVVDGGWKNPSDGGYSYYGRGLADTPLYHYFYFKMMALKFMMKELERYGMPFKVLYTGPQNAQLQDKLAEIMTALKNDSVVTIPGKKGEVEVDLMTATRSGNMFALFINYIDSLITKTILGQELMTEMPGVGSYAAASVHQSVFGLINEQDRLLVKDTMNRTLIRYDAQLNYPNVKEEFQPQFDFKKSPIEDVAGFLGTVESATRLGVTVSENQVREYTGLREPLPGEKVIELPEPEPMAGETEVDVNGKPKPKPKKPEDKDKKNGKNNTKQKYALNKMKQLRCPRCGKLFFRAKKEARTVIPCPSCRANLTFGEQTGAKLITQPKDD
jgi:phage gp29-like protein